MAEQTSDTATEQASVPSDVVAPTNGAREPAPSNDEAPSAGAHEAPATEAAGVEEASAAEAAGAEEAPAAEAAATAEARAVERAGVRIAPPPGRGPVVLADERGKPEPKPPTAPRRGQAGAKPKPQRPRRRKRSAAERHRAVFFARLNELRRGEQTDDSAGQDAEAHGAGQPAVEGPPTEERVAEAQEPQPPAVEEPAPGEPVVEQAEQPEGELSPAGTQPVGGRGAAPPPPVSQARLAAAIQRVGGPEVVEEALRPKTDEQGERKKWALVCCEAAQGRQAGDPEFTAWLRLAATPVREIKASLPVREEQGRGGGRRGGGPGRGGDRPPREGGGERGRGGDHRGRSGRGDRVSREELESFARGGKLTSKVRIVDPAAEKRERERQRKEERERKRQAERDRLARLGY